MGKSLKRTLIETSHAALMTVTGVEQIFDFEWTPIDRDGIITPSIFLFFDETAWVRLNRIERMTGDLVIESVYISDDNRRYTGLELLDYESDIHTVIMADVNLRKLLSKIDKLPPEYQSVGNDEIHIIQRYSITLQYAWSDLTTQSY